MKLHNPSADTIKKQLHSVYKLRDVVYTLIWSLMRASGDASANLTPSNIHKQIDEMLGNHGVETMRFKYRGEVRTLHYSNTGDTYAPTIMRWDWQPGDARYVIWMVGCWGDIAENPNYKEVSQWA